MSDVATRVVRLKDRIKRRREEVHKYLDSAFYQKCRSVLDTIVKLDKDGIFASNPSSLADYALRVSHPMWWKLIYKRLDRYFYNDKMDFIQDMRLVVNNCYAYNDESSQVAALGREVEIAMEDLFITALALPPPDSRAIVQLGKGLPKPQARQLIEIIRRYGELGEGSPAARQHVVPSQLKCATQRRVLAFLRQQIKLDAGEKNTRAEKAPPPPPTPPAVLTVKKPVVVPQYPTRNILETEADVEFSSNSKEVQNLPEEPHFERVPQNQRSGFSSFQPVSPVHFDESSEEIGGDEY